MTIKVNIEIPAARNESPMKILDVISKSIPHYDLKV